MLHSSWPVLIHFLKIRGNLVPSFYLWEYFNFSEKIIFSVVIFPFGQLIYLRTWYHLSYFCFDAVIENYGLSYQPRGYIRLKQVHFNL